MSKQTRIQEPALVTAERHTRASATLPAVKEETPDDGRDNPDAYRLLTTILDPAEASAEELAIVYSERWEIESVFDELKTHQRGPRMVMRSQSPDLVKQGIWGHLCCHYAIRTLTTWCAIEVGWSVGCRGCAGSLLV